MIAEYRKDLDELKKKWKASVAIEARERQMLRDWVTERFGPKSVGIWFGDEFRVIGGEVNYN